MVMEMNSQGKVEWTIQSEQQPKNQPFSSIGRQSSVYSLTLDEVQHTLCESGKNFGSMNMEEFISGIWNAEENQNSTTANNHTNNSHLSLTEISDDKAITKQPSLPRQGSLTLPTQLCWKTVDEIWSEIHQGQQDRPQNGNKNGDKVQNPGSVSQQPTFGEMTLEDFLVKAGVVRESCPVTAPASQQPYSVCPNNDPAMGPSFVQKPFIGMPGVVGAGGAGDNVVAPGDGAVGEPSGYTGRLVNGGGGYGVAAPMSPVSPDAIGTYDNSGSQFAMEMGVMRGRKRIIDGPVEKVVERRQRRMIKNRESAARSRARTQAYTVELEAELNQLRKENSQLKHTLCFEELNMRLETKEKDRFRVLRRNLSCPL